MKISSRRTLTYFQSGSQVITRPPHTRMPRLLARKSRMTLMLTGYGLRMSCSPLLSLRAQPDDAADDLVGRRLVHAALDVGARVDAEHVPDGGIGVVVRRRPGSSGNGSGIDSHG